MAMIIFYRLNVHTKLTLSLIWRQILIYHQFCYKNKNFRTVGTKLNHCPQRSGVTKMQQLPNILLISQYALKDNISLSVIQYTSFSCLLFQLPWFYLFIYIFIYLFITLFIVDGFQIMQ